MRQIKVIEYLFELKRIQFKDIADFLGVNKVTIKRDIEKIIYIEPKIRVIFENATTIEVKFWKNATRYELIKKLYYQSHFLRVCSYYFLGETNYLKIVEKEHISVAKAFYLKKKAEEFFIAVGIMDETKRFIEDESKYRTILLTLWMRIDLFDDRVDLVLFNEAEQIVRTFIKEFSNTLNERERHFFKLAIYLSLKRKDKNINIEEHDIKHLKKGVLYPKIVQILSAYYLSENEIRYIARMYYLLNQNLNTYQYLKIDYNFFRKEIIDSVPEITELIRNFETKFNRELLKDIMFEKPFLRFIISTFLERQMFLVEKHYFLGEQQRKIYPEIEQIMLEWRDKYSIDMNLSQKTTEKFCLQVSEVLLHNSDKKWNVFIVAEDEYSHVAYREWIERKLNAEHIIVDSLLYYSIEDLPVYIDVSNSLVICERTLMNDLNERIRDSKTFPVSLYSVNKDLQSFFEYISFS